MNAKAKCLSLLLILTIALLLFVYRACHSTRVISRVLWYDGCIVASENEKAPTEVSTACVIRAALLYNSISVQSYIIDNIPITEFSYWTYVKTIPMLSKANQRDVIYALYTPLCDMLVPVVPTNILMHMGKGDAVLRMEAKRTVEVCTNITQFSLYDVAPIVCNLQLPGVKWNRTLRLQNIRKDKRPAQ